MLKVLLVTPQADTLALFAAALSAEGDIVLDWAGSGAAALKRASKSPPDVMVIDNHLGDMPGLELIRRALTVNAMINSALISSLPPDDFHRQYEGLGILVQLPPDPGADQARDLVRRLREVTSTG